MLQITLDLRCFKGEWCLLFLIQTQFELSSIVCQSLNCLVCVCRWAVCWCWVERMLTIVRRCWTTLRSSASRLTWAIRKWSACCWSSEQTWTWFQRTAWVRCVTQQPLVIWGWSVFSVREEPRSVQIYVDIFFGTLWYLFSGFFDE